MIAWQFKITFTIRINNITFIKFRINFLFDGYQQ